MNFKQLYREYRIFKLVGSELNPEVKEVIDFLEENLTGLNCYTSDKWLDYNFYGKDRDNIVLHYNKKNGDLYVHYDKIWSFFSSKMSYNRFDTQDIINWWVGSTLKLKPSNTITNIFVWISSVGSTLKLKPTYTTSARALSNFSRFIIE